MTDAIERLEEFANGLAEYWDEAPPSLAKDNNGKMARLLSAIVNTNLLNGHHERCQYLVAPCYCGLSDLLATIETELGDVDET